MVNIRADTPNFNKAVFFFFNGGPDNLPKLFSDIAETYDFVDQNVYNHLYGDFRLLESQFPYLINSSFFDYIFVGKDTFMYFSTSSIIINFCSMLKPGGTMNIVANSGGISRSKSPRFHEFIDETRFSISAYFYNEGETDNDRLINFGALHFVNFCKYNGLQNHVSALKERISQKIPFVTEFFDQNERGAVILSITKNSV